MYVPCWLKCVFFVPVLVIRNTQFQAAYYFNKIQCFCFEEQILNPGERVDLPVFFYIDPEYANDPALEYLDSILLSYTFFEAKSDLVLPSPFDPNNRPSVKGFLGRKKTDTEVAVKSTSTEKKETNEVRESAPKASEGKLSENED
uniref:Cytochrome c oxidase assembly protein COX11 n=1 Tax=Parascaris equorum TaxID=6256 RepID=A0A914RGQ9_PAREQ